MKRTIYIQLLSLFMLSSCCNVFNNDIDFVANRHREKLREHFSYGIKKGRCNRKNNVKNNTDISTLINETRNIASILRRNGRVKEANEFDSYVDVLMFGNRTIDESLNDVMVLVKKEGKKRGFWEKLVGTVCD